MTEKKIERSADSQSTVIVGFPVIGDNSKFIGALPHRLPSGAPPLMKFAFITVVCAGTANAQTTFQDMMKSARTAEGCEGRGPRASAPAAPGGASSFVTAAAHLGDALHHTSEYDVGTA